MITILFMKYMRCIHHRSSAQPQTNFKPGFVWFNQQEKGGCVYLIMEVRRVRKADFWSVLM